MTSTQAVVPTAGVPAEAAPAPAADTYVSVRHVSKEFAGNYVLRDAGLDLRRGEIHALLGPNGSGKSTLIKVLTGYHTPDPGVEATIDGRPAKLTRHGLDSEDGRFVVKTVHQDLGLVPKFSAVDNIGMVSGYRHDRMGRVQWREQVRRTRALLAMVGLEDHDVHKPLDRCEPLERTQIALARALHGWEDDSSGLLILDEPTATLPSDQVDRLFSIVRAIAARGVTVLYVSHRLSEIFAVADRVTALREGLVVGTRDVGDLDRDRLVELMMGRASGEATAVVEPAPAEAGAVDPLVVTGLSSHTVHDVSFTLRPGEVLGFAGLVGSGVSELPYLLTGATKADAGTISVGGKDVAAHRMTPRRAKSLGVGLVPADRKRESLLWRRPVSENLGLPQVRRFQRHGWLRRKPEVALAEQWIDALGVVPADAHAEVDHLSGGNQQKVVLAKWLAVATKALVLAEPTAGVDIHAKDRIYDEILRQARGGLPIIICSTDTTDLVRTCNRVVALDSGRAVATFTGAAITEDNIVRRILHSSSGDRPSSQGSDS